MNLFYFSLLLVAVCFQATVQDSLDTEHIIKTQQKQLDDLQAEIRNLKERIDCDGTGNRQHQAHDDKEEAIRNDVKDTVNLKKKRFQQSETVAFYVYMSGNRCYSNHETFIFDVQETNIGNSYNGNDGIFDAPVTGTYVFTVTVGSNYNTYVTAEIVVNGKVKGTAFANSEDIHDLHSASGTVVVHVNAGEHVFVRRGAATNNCSIYSSSVYTWTAFSGWLLF